MKYLTGTPDEITLYRWPEMISYKINVINGNPANSTANFVPLRVVERFQDTRSRK